MKNFPIYKLFIFLFIQITFIFNSYGAWTKLDLGINYDISGVWFNDSLGAVVTTNGLYYTNNDGLTPSDWTKYTIYGNSEDSTVLANTIFKHCNGFPYLSSVYAVGQDTLNNRSIIFSLNLNTLDYAIIYQGAVGSSLNYLTYSTNSSKLHIVGDDGVFMTLTSSGIINQFSLGTNLDLKSISTFGTKFTIVADNALIRADLSTNNVTGLTVQTDTTRLFSSVIQEATYTYVVGDDIYTFLNANNNVSTNYSYDFGPINANCIVRYNNRSFIGTDHGIFVAMSNSGTAEWQPSSLKYNIRDIIKDPLINNIFYACGENGVLLKNTGSLYEAKPYVDILSSGGSCVSTSFFLNHISGSANSCSWLINGQLVQNNCNSSTFTINTVGTYQITKIGTNAFGFSDTATISYNITDVPQVNLPFAISDSILCKEEQIQIELLNSEPNIVYKVRRTNNSLFYGQSSIGNGSDINIITSPISQTGTYYIEASNASAPSCKASFTETFPIVVEHTKAKFHQNKVNVQIGEELHLFEHSDDAQIFNWTFPSNASLLSSSSLTPKIHFSSNTQGLIQLIASSINGCHDTLQEMGPMVYEPNPLNDSCWINVNLGPDLPWQGSYIYKDISKMAKSSTGYIISGNSNETVMPTQIGDSILVGDHSFVCKYNDDGILKWLIRFNGSDKTNITSVTEDLYGNIYVVGSVGYDAYLSDNIGDSIPLHMSNIIPGTSGSNSFILKIDSLGKFSWNVKVDGFNPYNVTIDKLNNLVIVGVANDAYIPIYLNNLLTDYIPNADVPSSYEATNSIIKLDENGNLVGNVQIAIDYVNGTSNFIRDVEFDVDNNMIASGNYEYKALIFNSTGGTNYSILDRFSSGYKQHAFLIKYDPNGNLIWKTRTFDPDGGSGSFYFYDIAIAPNSSDIYISGSNNSAFYLDVTIYENPDGTTYTTNEGQAFLGKVDENGFCLWKNAASSSYYGGMTNLIINDTSIQALGWVGNNTNVVEEVTLTSTDNKYIDLILHRADYFIANYSFDGELNNALLSGFNPNYYPSVNYGVNGFFQKDNGDYYMSQNIFLNSSETSVWQVFGSELNNTDGRAGYVQKFSAPCATFYPSIINNNTYLYDTICANNSYTFVDNTLWLNISTDTSYVMELLDINGLDSFVTTYLEVYPSTPSSSTIISSCDSVFFQSNWYFNSLQIIDTFSNVFGCDSFHFTNIEVLHEVGGVLTSSSSIPIVGAKVYQIWFNDLDSSLQIVDSIYTNNLGQFSFHNSNTLAYIKAIPPMNLFPNEIPTYSANSPVFQFAESTNCNINANFSTIQGVNPGGNGFISGFIGSGAGKTNDLGEPISGLNVFLINLNNEVVVYTSTNNQGYFEFNNISCSSYKIWVDDIRVNNLEAPEVILINQDCFADSLIFNIVDNKLVDVTNPSTHIFSTLKQNFLFTVAPNPAQSFITLNLNFEFISSEFYFELSNIFGQVIDKVTIENKTTILDLSNLSKGLYFVSIMDINNHSLSVEKFIIHE